LKNKHVNKILHLVSDLDGAVEVVSVLYGCEAWSHIMQKDHSVD